MPWLRHGSPMVQPGGMVHPGLDGAAALLPCLCPKGSHARPATLDYACTPCLWPTTLPTDPVAR